MAINGKEYSWQSIELRLSGAPPMVAFTAIKYPWKVERELVVGASRRPLGMTRGKFVPEDGSITMSESEYRDLAATPGWCDVDHTIVVQYAEDGMPTVTDTVIGVRFGGADSGAEEGVEGLKREIPFKFLDLLLNGVAPIGV